MYKIWLWYTGAYIYIDFRDDRYPEDFGACPDIEIHWNGNNWSAGDAGGTPSTKDNGETFTIWEMFGKEPQSYSGFRVPITVNTNSDAYGVDVDIEGEPEDSPYTNTTGYTMNDEFEIGYDDTQTSTAGYKFDFLSWSDAGAKYHDVPISSLDAAITLTATLDDPYIPVPTGFSLGTQSDHPYLTWGAVTGTAMGGYKIERNYDGGGYSVVATIGTIMGDLPA